MTAPIMRAYTELLVADLPPARRVRDRRHGGVHPEPQGPRGQRGAPSPRSARTRSARPATGFDGSWVAHPDLVAGLPGGLRRRARRPPEPARPAARRRPTSTAERPARRRLGAGRRSPRTACAATSRSASAYLEAWLGGNGAVGDPQPHGGRRDRRDLALADLAVGPQRRRSSTNGEPSSPPSWSATSMEQEHGAIRAELGDAYDDRNFETGVPRAASRSRWPTTTPTS